MSKGRRIGILLIGAAAVAAVGGALLGGGWHATLPSDVESVDRLPEIRPDYIGCTIPPNIAPLNFMVTETGTDYRVRIHGATGGEIVLAGRSGKIIIPPTPWAELLERNRGGQIGVDVYVRSQAGRWRRFTTITNHVAADRIDPYVVYRLLGPLHHRFVEMGTYQRHLETFDESPILVSPPGAYRCANCHTFVGNRPETFILHVRDMAAKEPSMLLARNGGVEKVDTRTERNPSPAAYSSWHPGGNRLAFSVNNLKLWLRQGGQSRCVIDYGSDVAVYEVDTGGVRSTGHLADPDYLETFPAWSADGTYLYFCRAKRTWPTQVPDRLGTYRTMADALQVPEDYRSLQYDLARIGYDVENDRWGKLETVVSGADIDRSISAPKPSPDGRFVLFTADRFGTFPIYSHDSDLYMLDLQTHRTWPLDINSDRTDSWHSWSSNSRWIVFASKRDDGLLAKLYVSYVHADGRAAKPVLLPQKDPAFYDGFLKTYNVPELVTGRVEVTHEQLLQALGTRAGTADAVSTATAVAE